MLLSTKESMMNALNKWANTTFLEAFNELYDKVGNTEEIWLLNAVLQRQNLWDVKMTGAATENLEKSEFECMGIKYVDVFNRVNEDNDYWTMLDIMYYICCNNIRRKERFYDRRAKEEGMSFEKMTSCMCGRVIRALPSFLREYQLKNQLQETFPLAVLDQSEYLDIKLHCDVKMILDDKEYYVWSFVSSQRGIANFADKFKSNRNGEVPNGYHLLCPYDLHSKKKEHFHDWLIYSQSYMSKIEDVLLQDPLDYQKFIKNAVNDVNQYHGPLLIKK